jgi:hypothetical protein
MNRRSFLRALGIAVGVALVALCNHCKEKIIARAFETPEGQEALARAMVEPIRRKMQEESFLQKILPPQPIPTSEVGVN